MPIQKKWLGSTLAAIASPRPATLLNVSTLYHGGARVKLQTDQQLGMLLSGEFAMPDQ